MTAFDKAWNLVKEEEDTRLKDALDAARMRPKKKKPLELPGYVRTGSKRLMSIDPPYLQDGKGDEE